MNTKKTNAPMPKRFWLMKSEPDVFSIDDLIAEKTSLWDGVRNYQARNFMQEMQVGDEVFFYHSNANPSAIVGLMEVVEMAQADPSQFNPQSAYFDEKATHDKPRWFCVRVGKAKRFGKILPLSFLKTVAPLTGCLLLEKGSRLSVMPISEEHANHLLALAGEII
ncbi:MAG: EVE domain-containing protein [Cardiobacteriaceae bacterium]|nr:EVE domain-containing protein [Cardiobacteriaceae bacterium]